MERGILTHAGYAGLDQGLRVGALNTPGKRLVGRVFDACVEKTARRQGQTKIAGHRIGLLALEEPAVVQPHLAALGLASGDEVDDAGDCVAPVLGRGAVAQDLDALQRDARNQADIGAVGALAGRRYELRDERGAVTTLAVDHDQRLVRRQPAQRRRAYEGVAVAGRDRGVERRDMKAQVVGDIAGIACLGEIVPRYDVDRHGGLRRRTPRPPRPDRHDLLDGCIGWSDRALRVGARGRRQRNHCPRHRQERMRGHGRGGALSAQRGAAIRFSVVFQELHPVSREQR